MNNRAISPLISTFVLIIFAVALGGVVMSWGRNIEIKEEHECDKAKLNAVKLNNEPQICYHKDVVDFLIENNGKVNLDGFIVNIIGNKDIEKIGVDKQMGITDIFKMSIPYNNKKTGNPLKIQFVPKAGKMICAESPLELEGISNCQ